MSRFTTLLQREWMQHQRGWLILMMAPPLLLLLPPLFVDRAHLSPDDPTVAMLASVLGASVLVLGVTLIAVFIQAPGLARRDQQDRSIEFWLSMPVRPSASVGATLVMHTLLIPLLALGVGFVAGHVVGLVLVAATNGMSGWLAIYWSSMFEGSLLLLLRAAFGVLLAMAWLAPLLLMVMAASAWLKRWGVAAVVAAGVMGHLVLSKVYGIALLGDAFTMLLQGASHAVVHRLPLEGGAHFDPALGPWPFDVAGMLDDAAASVADLAQPVFWAGVVVSAACFALLVLRRRRG